MSGPGRMEVWRSKDGAEIAVIAPTWYLNPKVTFESLKKEFERDENRAWRNYGSIFKGSSERPAPPELVVENANRARQSPWDPDSLTLASWFRPDPRAEYFVHIDLAKRHDRAGVACVHRERRTGRIVVDLMEAVAGKAGRDIQFADLREHFVFELTRRGFHIKTVSYDQWQSVDSAQILTSRGYTVIEQSADKTFAPYDTLFELLKANKLDYYLHPTFVREMQNLRRYAKKYDHPRGGGKDLSDAVACASFVAIQDAIDNPNSGDTVVIVNRHNQRREYE